MIKNKQQQKWNNFWGNFSQLLPNEGVHWWQEGEGRTLWWKPKAFLSPSQAGGRPLDISGKGLGLTSETRTGGQLPFAHLQQHRAHHLYLSLLASSSLVTHHSGLREADLTSGQFSWELLWLLQSLLGGLCSDGAPLCPRKELQLSQAKIIPGERHFSSPSPPQICSFLDKPAHLLPFI